METILDGASQEPAAVSIIRLNSRAALLVVLLTASCPPVFCQEVWSTVQAMAANDAASPVQIESVKQVPVDTNLSPQVAARSVTFDVTVVNTLPQAIMLYGVSYEFEDASNGTHLTRVCFSSSTFDPATPPLPARTSKTLHPSFARSPKAKTIILRPKVDLVLLDDGRYYGKDVCGALERYQSLLDDRGTYAGILLNYLQTNGGDKTLEFLRKEVARRDSIDRLLLNSKKMNRQKIVIEKTQ